MDLGVRAVKGYSAFLKAIPKASLSDGLVSYPGHMLRGLTPLQEIQSAYSRAPAECIRGYAKCTIAIRRIMKSDD